MVHLESQRTTYLEKDLISEKITCKTITVISQTCALHDQYIGATDLHKNILRYVYKSNLDIDFIRKKFFCYW